MNLLWKKRMRSAGWLMLTATGIVLLVAGSQKKYNKECADIKVEVSGVNRHVFLDEKEVEKILTANGDLIGEPIEAINLQLLEARLEKDKWIRNAELFFDNNQVLQVMVEEREPVARIFTIGGNSYYIDSAGSRLPLSDKVSIRVPMFTNFPSERTRLGRRDSILMVLVKQLATFIQADSFWNAQVSQVDITADRAFEMIPTIGNHKVVLGKGEDFTQKFNRLFSFYKQVWTRVGMESYSTIDVQYKGQVVAIRRGVGNAFIDSAKAKEAFLNLVNRNKPDTIDEAEAVVKPAVVKEVVASPTSNLAAKVKSEIAKAAASSKEVTKLKAGTKNDNEDKKPKAVMQKRN
jgi:cell division protein FtsQ